MLPTLHYLFLTALRDRLFLVMVLALAAVLFFSAFLGEQFLVEGSSTAMVFGAGALRFIIVAGLMVFGAFHIRRADDGRELMLMASRPISRLVIVLSYWISLAGLAAMLVGLAVLVILLVGDPDRMGLLLWSGSLWLEAVLMAAVTLFFALSLRGIVGVMAGCMGFYVLARLIGVFMAIANSSYRTFSDDFSKGSEDTINLVGLFLPRLDLFARSEWLLYGQSSVHMPYLADPVVLITLQACVYTAFILTAAMYDFSKKSF